MTALPPSSDLTQTGITKGTFKTALNNLRAYLSGLLGDAGTQSAALSGLGALLNGSLGKPAGYTVVAADRGKLIDCSGSGGWTLAVDAVATLGAGFAFGVRNGTTGSITINPNLSEQINGASTLILWPGDSCAVLVNSDATALLAVFNGGGGGSTGQIAHFAMNTAPTGWLKANGAAVSRTSYAVLFSAIGTTFGAGDGSTTFNLPDLRGEFLRGWDDGRGVDSGRVFGSAQSGAMESHTHTISSTSDSTGSGTQAYTVGGTPGSLSTGSAGSGSETRPRNIALLACIKY